MIIKTPAHCDACGEEINEPHLHHFHPICAYETGWRMQKNAGKLMNRERKKKVNND